MKKKILFFAAALLGICNAYAVVKWDGTSSTKWSNGMGTKTNPYLIEKPAHLAYLSSQVTAGNTYTGMYFKQTEDFNLNSKTWQSIGNDTYQFAGIYDGDNKTISNVQNYLFGTTYYAKIANVIITGDSYALINKANGITEITNCHNKATKLNSLAGLIYQTSGSATLTKCSNQAEIAISRTVSTTTTIYVGGLIAINEGDLILSECFNTASVSCDVDPYNSSYNSETHVYAGGLVGYSSRPISIKQCYNSGNISARTNSGVSGKRSAYAAGLIGYMPNGQIEQCYNAGNISSSTNSSASTFNAPACASQIANGSSLSVLACYARGISTAISGLPSSLFSKGNIESCYYTESAEFNGSNCYHNKINNTSVHSVYKSDVVMKSELILPLLNTLGDYFTKDLEGINDGYPILKWQAGTRYTITATCDANRGTVTGGGEYPNGYTATLTATPKPGCTFVGWSDGETANPRYINVAGEATYTAQFTKSSYTIYINQDCTSNIE